MSDNFWDVKLNEKDELAERKKEDDSKTKATTPVPKAEVEMATKLSIGITPTV